MIKQTKKSTFTYLILSIFALFLSRNHTESFWKTPEINNKRSPSSEGFKRSTPQLYSDFFGSNKKLRVEFWTNRDASIQKLGRTALQQGISNSLLGKDLKEFPKEILNKNLIQSFSKSFLDSLQQLNIERGLFQIDLHFEPSEPREFEVLMSSNQLINHSNTGTVLESLEQKEISFDKKILRRAPQKQKDKYHSLGGVITLWFNLSNKEPLAGFVKYRRYFSMKRDWNPSLNTIEDKKLEGEWESNDQPRLLTVDITDQLDSNSLMPSPGKLEIFFGKVKFPKKFRTNILSDRDLFSDDTEVNKLLLSGSYPKFTFHLKKLEFDLVDLNFSNGSNIRSYGKWRGYTLGQKRELKRETRRFLLGSGATTLIKDFALYRFDEKFKKVGER